MFVNLTPHAIVVGANTIPPSGHIVRVSAIYTDGGIINGIEIQKRVKELTNLPPKEEDTFFIVEKEISLLPDVIHRSDIVSPLLPERIGSEVHCKGLVRN